SEEVDEFLDDFPADEQRFPTTPAQPSFDADWFDAEAGLVTVRGLIRYLTDNARAAMNPQELKADLQDFETVLDRLAREGIRRHLAVDF
ncbi:MAG TPA: hypothetical protein VKI17_06960, partial [Gemmataceae bacterium]|nr:hypothetical protein [Gemmataceae bacterium]